MNELEQFFTRQEANEGIEVPLYLPDGKESGHKIRIRSFDSDAFHRAQAEEKRKLFAIASSEDKEALKKLDPLEFKLNVLCSLVISWTFQTPCTKENIENLLREAPQIADAIDNIAGNRSLFLKSK